MHRSRVAGTVLMLVAAVACSQPTAAPTPTIAIPPEALSDLNTAVALVSTQAAQMQAVVASAQPSTATPSPTPEEATESLNERDSLASASAPLPAVAPRPTALSVTDAAPCSPGQVKGNINSMIYHLPGGGSYARTKANVVCFATEAHATAAGYRKARN